MARGHKESTLNWALGALATLLLAALGYAVTTSWQNADRLAQVSEDMKSVKSSLVRISLKTSPNDPAIPLELLSSKGAKEGLKLFTAGNYPAAYETWSAAAVGGDQISALAIGAARESLELKLKDDSLTAEQRKIVASGVASAPVFEIIDGKIVLKRQE